LEGIGSIADALDRHQIACTIVGLTAPGPQPPTPGALSAPSGLILMGGPMSVNDDLPWIPHEIAAIREAVRRGIPVLGVCLGAQLIARALGARVYPNPEKEIGWAPLHWTPAAATDRLFHGFSEPETVFQCCRMRLAAISARPPCPSIHMRTLPGSPKLPLRSSTVGAPCYTE
jgi:GMP synthase-like glutamine amidotransferase